jgi:hypothetical protein
MERKYSCRDDNERVNLKIGELQVDVYAVKSHDEINENVLCLFRDLG